MALEDLTPAVRVESILNGDEITPANRLEYFLQKAATELPKPAAGDAGKVLTVNEDADGVEWKAVGGGLPEVTSSDEGKVLAVNASGEWAADDMFIFIDNDDDLETLGVTPRQVISAIKNHKIILICSLALGETAGSIYPVTQVIDGQFVDPNYEGKYVTTLAQPTGAFAGGLPVIGGMRYVADTLDDIFTFD